MLDSAEQEAPAANLNLGGKANPGHGLLSHLQPAMDRRDCLGHVVAGLGGQFLGVEVFQVRRPGQSQVAALFGRLDQLPCVPPVSGDVQCRFTVATGRSVTWPLSRPVR